MFNMEPTQLNMLKCQNLAYQFVAYIKPGIQKAQPGGETQCPQLAYVWNSALLLFELMWFPPS